MSDVLIIDDAIPLDVQNDLAELCLSVNFPWFFHPTSAYEKSDLEKYNFDESFFKNSVDTMLFTHVLYGNNGVNSQFFKAFKPVVESIPDVANSTLNRFKINLTMPDSCCNSTTHSIAHVDLVETVDYKTALYYINDSDGDTIIFNERWPYNGALTIKQRITPKKGRLVVFDGKCLHAGNNPSAGARLTANINIIL